MYNILDNDIKSVDKVELASLRDQLDFARAASCDAQHVDDPELRREGARGACRSRLLAQIQQVWCTPGSGRNS